MNETFRFNNANIHIRSSDSAHFGPLLDSGSPYLAFGLLKLNVLAGHFGQSPIPTFNSNSHSLGGYKSRKHDFGTHTTFLSNV